MSILMIEEENDMDAIGGIMLCDYDYPDGYVNGMHPTDGIVATSPIEPQLIFTHKTGHSRLFLRISFKLGPNRFIPFTFVCDTGAPRFIYFSEIAETILKNSKRIVPDENSDEYNIYISNRPVRVSTDHKKDHKDVNIIGLLLLSRFGLKVIDDEFSLERIPKYL